MARTTPKPQTRWLTRYGLEITADRKRSRLHDLDESKGSGLWTHQEKCRRCGGAGGFSGWPGFTCFDCGGNCLGEVKTDKVYTEEKLAKLNATKEASRVRKVRKEIDKMISGLIADPVRIEIALICRAFPENTFLADIGSKAVRRGLTENQINAVPAAIEREFAYARRQTEQAAERAASAHVGVVGDRDVMELEIAVVRESDGQFGMSYWHLMKTVDGDVVIYRGSKHLGDSGDNVVVKATIKEHREYQDTLQTVIARPAEVN